MNRRDFIGGAVGLVAGLAGLRAAPAAPVVREAAVTDAAVYRQITFPTVTAEWGTVSQFWVNSMEAEGPLTYEKAMRAFR